MIGSALLNRLQKADPETWKKYQAELGEMHTFDSEGYSVIESIDVSDLNEAAQVAWLQHVLQDACRARYWAIYQISNPGLPKETYYADMQTSISMIQIYILRHLAIRLSMRSCRPTSPLSRSTHNIPDI